VVDRPVVEDAQEHERRVRLARIESLQHSPAWDDLIDLFEKTEERYWRRHVANVKAGAEIDQRELDRARGMFEGIRDICKAPLVAARKLERLADNNEEETS